ncbi:MAG: RNB domain-containing ribonuclease [Gammaproteobacteria bacterium]
MPPSNRAAVIPPANTSSSRRRPRFGKGGGSYESLVDALVAERGLTDGFDDSANAEAKKAAANFGGNDRRKDYRDTPFVTIDDDSARDFDDAVYCRKADNDDAVLLVVAIADVAAFVAPGGVLDNVAKLRGNSVYLPDRVLPMLPAALSEGACSLRPGEDRFCLACEMEVLDGMVRDYCFRRGIMRSAQRLNYQNASKMMRSGELALFAEMTAAFRRRRRDNGGLMIERPETKVRLQNETLHREETRRDIAHWAIEECMIAANQCAADFLVRRRVPALHRVHKKPADAGMRKLAGVLRQMAIPFPSRPVAADFGYALDIADSRSPSLGAALTPVILGALGRAAYSPDDESGHYGLACERYTHFTSPIRRYPDLITHRALLKAMGDADGRITADLTQTGEYCSQTEHIADKMEWQIRQRLFCRAVQDDIGEVAEGYITGAAAFGLFVNAPKLRVEGMVPFSKLPGYWQFDEPSQSITSREGKTFSLGDKLNIRLDSVIAEKGKVNFSVVDC